jgi:glycosyltransferase involved in cell wall biosynthesis
LVPAFAHLRKSLGDAVLAIVGPDNEGLGTDVRNWCSQSGVEGKVLFSDHLPPDQVRQAYRDADLFVLPSYSENFGMTVIEAMACQCPVLISDRVNICDDIPDVGAGRVVSLDAEQLSDAMHDLFSNPPATVRMAATGRAFVQQHYSWDSVNQQLTTAYQQLLRQHPARRR